MKGQRCRACLVALGDVACAPPGQVFSQHPYAENFIGKPHVWTVDYNNSEEFEAAIKAIMRTQVRCRPRWGPHEPILWVSATVRKRCPSWRIQTHRPGWADVTPDPPHRCCVKGERPKAPSPAVCHLSASVALPVGSSLSRARPLRVRGGSHTGACL